MFKNGDQVVFKLPAENGYALGVVDGDNTTQGSVGIVYLTLAAAAAELRRHYAIVPESFVRRLPPVESFFSDTCEVRNGSENH